jgi:hypothetical protein
MGIYCRLVVQHAGTPRVLAYAPMSDAKREFRRAFLGLIRDSRCLSEKHKTPDLRRFLGADDGTRTHDLLHGKCWRPFAPVRSGAPKPAVCSDLDEGE